MSSCIAFPLLYLGSMRTEVGGPVRLVMVVAVSLVVGIAMDRFIETLGGGAAGALMRMVGYSSGGGERVAFEHSQLQAMVERGEVDAALREYEAALVAHPADAALRLRVADVYARRRGDHARAAALFREGRALFADGADARSPAARDATLYATQRLIDLYDGPLGDQGRALVELRRLIETFPNSREAAAARATLARWKGEGRERTVARPGADGGNV